MKTTKSRIQGQDHIPTFVGGWFSSNHFPKAGRKPVMDLKCVFTKEKPAGLLGGAAGFFAPIGLSLLANHQTRQVIDGSCKFNGFRSGNLSNELVGLGVGDTDHRFATGRVKLDIKVAIHRCGKSTDLLGGRFNRFSRHLGRFLNAGGVFGSGRSDLTRNLADGYAAGLPSTGLRARVIVPGRDLLLP